MILGEEEGISMSPSTDFDAYNTQGLYKCVNTEYSNAPVAGNITGILEVFRISSSLFIIQRMTIVYVSSPFIEVYQRRYRKNNQTWSSWYKVTMNVVS